MNEKRNSTMVGISRIANERLLKFIEEQKLKGAAPTKVDVVSRAVIEHIASNHNTSQPECDSTAA